MQKTHFSSVQLALIDPTPQGVRNREEILNVLAVTKVVSGSMGIGCALTCIFGTTIAMTWPITGGLLFVSGLAGGLVSRDIYVIIQNGEDMLKNFTELRYTATSELFVARVFKDAYIAPVLSSLCIQVLNQKT